MPKKRYWAVMREGCWLAAYRCMGVREFIYGELVDIPTGIYSSDIRCAKVFKNRRSAEEAARQLDGKVFELLERPGLSFEETDEGAEGA